MNSLPPVPGPHAGALFASQGFLAPVPLYTAHQCKLILSHFRSATLPDPHVWSKGYATCDRFIYDIATRPALLDVLKQILGRDIVLWGASLVERDPEQVHAWHTDIESSSGSGGFASVWVGLENTSAGSSLQLISGSHRFGKPIQQVMRESGVSRLDTAPATVANWASKIDPDAQLVQPAVRDGEAIVFDGRLWHGSKNSSGRKRAALLLQYVKSDTPVFIPDLGNLEWPFHFTAKRPPAILVSGVGNAAGHDLLLPPSACPPDKNDPVRTFVGRGSTYAEDPVARWVAHQFFHGHTANAEAMESHLSVLSPGHSPHPPHAHVEEELLLVLDGIAEILITDDDKSEGRVEVLGPGSFVYHPAYQHHTIRNRSDAPVTYLMYKWQSCPLDVEAPLQSDVCRWDHPNAPAGSGPMWSRVVLEAPTAYLTKLHAHQTVLQPGGGYAAHADEHDVAIIVISGTIRTAEQDIGPRGIVFFPAGELHGMDNPGPEAAHYLVFEFHAPDRGEGTRIGRSADQRDFWARTKDQRDWARGLKKFFRKQKRSIEKRITRWKR
jgi:uncharacterized cupin superfamily protein